MRNAKWLLTAFLLVVSPIIAHAQWDGDEDRRNPYQYEDVDNGQLLQLFSYILTPIGMGLEWGVTRPLHNLATTSSIAPLLSGDRNVHYFGHNNNSDLVPSGTFEPAPVNLSNYYVSEPSAASSGTMRQSARTVPAPPPSQRTFQ
jgi:hypothetical protein